MDSSAGPDVVNPPPAAHAAREPSPPARKPTPAAELAELLRSRSGERHVVAIQDFPDPDAISSALAYRAIAAGFQIAVDIMYEGLISHPENLALVNLLDIDLLRYQDDVELDGYDAAVYVDNQGSTTRLTSRLQQAGVPALVVIDHHDPQDLLDPVFRDVRPVGAAATLLAEYLESGTFFELQRSNRRHVELATALLHGLHSETSNFISAEPPEYRAAAFLTPFADTELLGQVMCVQKSRGTMDTIEAALGRRIIRGGLSLAGVGYLRWADRDAIPQAADFLLQEENVNTAVVFGIVTSRDHRESVMGSLRTRNATLGVDAFLKQALGRDTADRFYGGGRSRAGGFEIDLGFLAGGTSEAAEKEGKWTLYERQIRRKLFEAAGVEKSKDEEKPAPADPDK